VEGTTPPPNKEDNMTRKDYVMIAESIAYASELTKIMGGIDEETRDRVISLVANKIASGLEMDNSRFDRARFLDACGVN
jgi:hypothetical protein